MGKVFAFVAGFFALLLASCADRAVRARLEAADSLMWSAPDSAYRILQAIAPAAPSTDGQRAYYGLLWTQAQYRTYAPNLSDSLILRSVFYYEGRDDYQYGLSLYYLGAVYQEKEFFHLAIEQYKRALEHLPTDNVRIVALIHNNMGTVYRKQYFGREAIDHYQQAANGFRALSDSTNLGYVCGRLGQSFHMESQPDSALKYYQKSYDLALRNSDSVQLGTVSTNIALAYVDLRRLIDAKCWVERSLQTNLVGSITDNQYLLLSKIALLEGCTDSAVLWLRNIKRSSLSKDKMLSEICAEQGKYRDAFESLQSYFRMTSESWDRREKIRVDEIAAQYDQQQLRREKEALTKMLWVWVGIGVLLLLLFVVAVVLHVMRRRQQLSEARNLIEALQTLDDRSARLRRTHETLAVFLDKRLKVLAAWTELSHQQKGDEKGFVRKVHSLIEQHPLDEEEGRAIVSAVNEKANGLMDFLRQNYPSLTESDLLVCALTYMGYSPYQLYAILSMRNAQSAYDKKYKVVRKMGASGELKTALDRVVLQLP